MSVLRALAVTYDKYARARVRNFLATHQNIAISNNILFVLFFLLQHTGGKANEADHSCAEPSDEALTADDCERPFDAEFFAD